VTAQPGYAEQTASRFTDRAHEHPLFLPDLTVWFEWHERAGTLPAPTLQEVCRGLGLPTWRVIRPWEYRTDRVEIRTEVDEDSGGKTVTYGTSAGELTARWTVGPDGDLWQTEYPAKSAADLAAVLEVARDRSYAVGEVARDRSHGVSRAAAGPTEEAASTAGDLITAWDLPMRPYSMLLYEFLGLSQGLMLLWDEPERIAEILEALENSLRAFVSELPSVSELPGRSGGGRTGTGPGAADGGGGASPPGFLVLSPDNLDSQFVSPESFRAYYAGSYRATADALHAAGGALIVHAGGPVGGLLEDLARSGVDGIEGIAGPPQGDTSLAAARERAGDGVTLWGGIPQDFLLDTHDDASFRKAVRAACREARGRSRMILGAADRVPPDASLERLASMPRLIEEHLGRPGGG